MTDVKQTLTPKGVAETSFADKAQEYEDQLKAKTAQETLIEKTKLEVRELFAKYDWNHSGDDLTGLEDKLVVYKPVKIEPQDGLVFVTARTEGRSVSEIVNNPSLFKRLSKKFGKEFETFFRQVDDVFHYKDIKPEEEQDEAKTKAFRNAYHQLVLKLTQAQIDLKQAEQNLKNIKDYIAFCKEIGTLAGQPQKGGDQKGQQQQKQQNN